MDIPAGIPILHQTTHYDGLDEAINYEVSLEGTTDSILNSSITSMQSFGLADIRIVVGPAFRAPSLRLSPFYPQLADQKLLYEEKGAISPNDKFSYRYWPKTRKTQWPRWIQRMEEHKKQDMIDTGIYIPIHLS